jgi:hypothetical protein
MSSVRSMVATNGMGETTQSHNAQAGGTEKE